MDDPPCLVPPLCPGSWLPVLTDEGICVLRQHPESQGSQRVHLSWTMNPHNEVFGILVPVCNMQQPTKHQLNLSKSMNSALTTEWNDPQDTSSSAWTLTFSCLWLWHWVSGWNVLTSGPQCPPPPDLTSPLSITLHTINNHKNCSSWLGFCELCTDNERSDNTYSHWLEVHP